MFVALTWSNNCQRQVFAANPIALINFHGALTLLLIIYFCNKVSKYHNILYNKFYKLFY